MLYGKYIFSCTFQEEAILPEYKGSTFRGVFGHALKKVVCALKRQECSDCLLRTRCVYSFVFETRFAHVGSHSAAPDDEDTDGYSREDSEKKRIASPPHPYVIEPFNSNQTRYEKGAPFDFTLLLFGRANDYLPYFIYAIDQMGQLGIGKRISSGSPPGAAPLEVRTNPRASFALMDVKANGFLVYGNGDGKIRNGNYTIDLSLASFTGEHIRSDIEISILTPLRLKYENRLEAALPFHILIRAMLRRVSSLCQYYGAGEPALDYRGLVAQAKEVEIGASSLRWFDWKRYSNRQDQSMLMGGLIGKVSYSGQLGPFLPLIRFCEEVHIGKQTAFGLGKIEVHPTHSLSGST